jgi:hypothetical protein
MCRSEKTLVGASLTPIACKVTIEVVTNRKNCQACSNCSEKVDNDFAALANSNGIKKLEQEYLFEDLDTSPGSRSVFSSSARNRFVFLCTAGSILRGGSVYEAELSDLFHMEGKVDKLIKEACQKLKIQLATHSWPRPARCT